MPCLLLLLFGPSTSGANAAEWTGHPLGGEAAAAPIFFVRDDKTGAVLLAGRLTNPLGI